MFSASEEPEHRQQLRRSVADFRDRGISSKQLRESLASDDGFSRARWNSMLELGWGSVLVPEESGGLGLEHGDVAALHHEIGRAALREPLVTIPLLVARALVLGENRALEESLIGDLLAGDKIGSLAWQGSAGALSSSGVGPVATRTAAGWDLSGEAQFVALADRVDGLVVAAKADNGVVLLWLDGRPEVRNIVTHTDGTRQATVLLDGVQVSSDAVIAGPQAGAGILDEILDTARLAISAELLGVMEQAFQMTLDYMKQRTQFGKAIASFQALQHRAVNLYIQIELARSALGRAVQAFETSAGPAERAAQVSAAKSRCGDAAQLVVKECIQLHGAIGYTEECDLSLYVNRALALAAWLGNPRAHRARYAEMKSVGGQTRGH